MGEEQYFFFLQWLCIWADGVANINMINTIFMNILAEVSPSADNHIKGIQSHRFWGSSTLFIALKKKKETVLSPGEMLLKHARCLHTKCVPYTNDMQRRPRKPPMKVE